MTEEVKKALEELIRGSKTRCSVTWRGLDKFYILPTTTQRNFSALAGREVSLDDFNVLVGGLEDGNAYPRTPLVEDILKNVSERNNA